MYTTNADYFSFNVDNSILLVGQTRSGKSYLEDRYIEKLLKAYKPGELQFVFLDMTHLDFSDVTKNHQEYVRVYSGDAVKSLEILEELAELSEERIKSSQLSPLLFILIEECDIVMIGRDRFEEAVVKINTNAKLANMKLIYSTSRPGEAEIPKKMLKSFDLILAGRLSNNDRNYLGVPMINDQDPYTFTVVGKN